MLEFYEAFQKCEIPDSLAKENEILDSNGYPITIIEELNKVNIFLGENNSGKSVILREILKGRRLKFYGEKNKTTIIRLYNRLKELIDSLHTQVGKNVRIIQIDHYANKFDFSGLEELFSELDKFDSETDIESKKTQLNHYINAYIPVNAKNNTIHLKNADDRIIKTLEILEAQFIYEIFEKIKTISNEISESLDHHKYNSYSTRQDIPKIYVPAVRSLRKFAITAALQNATRNEYDFDAKVDIVSGEHITMDINAKRNDPDKQNEVFSYEAIWKDFLNEPFFSLGVDSSPNSNNKNPLLKIGSEAAREIHQLGDGLQMLIILTYPFLKYECGFIIIEEPELFIHPGLQKKIMNFFCNHPKTKNFQIFITTHSNHIVDSIIESDNVSIFTVRKQVEVNASSNKQSPKFVLENVAYGNENILRLLGVTNTSVFLSNCSIWVEGISDAIYLRKYLLELSKKEPYSESCKNYKEGINYTFAFTGGDSIVHLEFDDDAEYNEEQFRIQVSKFCGRAFVLVDSDNNKNPERKRILRDVLSEERFEELAVTQIEDLLNLEVIKNVIGEYPSIKKQLGKVAFGDIKDCDMVNPQIGYIIDEVLLKDFDNSKKIFSQKRKEDSGLKSAIKREFSEKAIRYITYDNMTQESIELAEKIWKFIIKQNRR